MPTTQPATLTQPSSLPKSECEALQVLTTFVLFAILIITLHAVGDGMSWYPSSGSVAAMQHIGTYETYDSGAEDSPDARHDSVQPYLGRSDSPTNRAIENHFSRARNIDPETLKFGDVLLMCTYHPVYQGALRPYLFWRFVLYKGRNARFS